MNGTSKSSKDKNYICPKNVITAMCAFDSFTQAILDLTDYSHVQNVGKKYLWFQKV